MGTPNGGGFRKAGGCIGTGFLCILLFLAGLGLVVCGVTILGHYALAPTEQAVN
jgi:hypothetical protein